MLCLPALLSNSRSSLSRNGYPKVVAEKATAKAGLVAMVVSQYTMLTISESGFLNGVAQLLACRISSPIALQNAVLAAEVVAKRRRRSVKTKAKGENKRQRQ